MKHVKLFENFINQNKYDAFIARIAELPEEEKEQLSDHWMDADEITSSLGSAVWTTLRIGNGRGFEERALRFLKTAGSEDPHGDLEEFIERY